MSMEAYEALTEQPPPNGNTAAAIADYEARYAQAMTIIRFFGGRRARSTSLKRDLDGTTSQVGRTGLAKELQQ